MSDAVKDVAVSVDKNPFALSGRRENNGNGGMIAVASSRQAQEVQAMAAIAKRFPRDQETAYTRIMTSCQRKGLAEGALYSYPRGGTQITGPSIRLAEALAQNWGNLDFGIVELEQRDGESTVMAYCVDLETNTRQTKIFQVAHERHTKTGVTNLTDPRDVYELVANQGARRLRSCILGVVPGDIIDAAVTQCEKTLTSGKEPIIDRIRVMATKFKEDFNVTVEMLEKRLMHKLDATNEQEMVSLRKIYTSLKDGMSKRADWFSVDDLSAKAPEGLSNDQPTTTAVPNEVLGEKKPKVDWGAKLAEIVTENGIRPDVILAFLKAKALIHRDTTVETLFTNIKPSLAKKYAENFDLLLDDLAEFGKQQAGATPPADTTTTAASPPKGEPTRTELVTEIRNKMETGGIAESELLAALYKLEIFGHGQLLTAVPSDMLKAVLADWSGIIQEI